MKSRALATAVLSAVVGLALLGESAPAQQWSPNRGWSEPQHDPFADHERRVAEMHARHEERTRKMDEEFASFERDTNLVMWGFLGLLGVVLLASIVYSVRASRRRTPWMAPEPDLPVVQWGGGGGVDVTVLRFGIDARGAKFVRTELEAILKTYPADQRARRLREVAIMLRRVRDSWIYGGVDNEPSRSHEDALAAFTKHVDEARSRVRAGQRAVTATASSSASSAVGPVSLLLVSVIVAARGELMTVTEMATAEDLRRALETATHRAESDIVGFDVVWVPDGDAQQISSLDLEAVYRRSELHPLAGATVGKVFCTYCGGPFPGELVSCPHCGGPAPGRERRA